MPTLFFDLDGTLTDSKPGITRCIQHALTALGHPAPHADELDWCVGPPLKQSFARLTGNDDPALLDRALLLYRERFSTLGLFENALYPDVLETLHALQAEGYRQFIVTAKPHVYARRIAEHFGLIGPIEVVYGSELDGTRGDKGELIAHVLQQERIDPAEALMIGDREHDMRGAADCRLSAIGATWGYGGAVELQRHGARHLAPHMRALPALVRQVFAG
ncbi:MAG: 5-nucleotidase [Betaproteobacteria bacterium]|nr:5-nucleotidase [Betaproteobacteria bacterium]